MEDLAKQVAKFKKSNPEFEVIFEIRLKDTLPDTEPRYQEPTPDEPAEEVPYYSRMTETVHDRWELAHADDPPIPCEVCGEEFKQEDPKQRFCSPRCRDLHQRPRIEQVEANCAFCHEQFLQTRRDNIYCSPRCASLARDERLGKVPLKETVRNCDRCEKQYTPKHPMQRYCDKDCKYEAEKQISKDRWQRHKETNATATKVCTHCHLTKTLADYYGRGSVCIECKRKSSKEYKAKTRVCSQCGKSTTKLYCSEECRKERERLAAETARVLTPTENQEETEQPLDDKTESASAAVATEPTEYKHVVLPPSGVPTPSKLKYRQW